MASYFAWQLCYWPQRSHVIIWKHNVSLIRWYQLLLVPCKWKSCLMAWTCYTWGWNWFYTLGLKRGSPMPIHQPGVKTNFGLYLPSFLAIKPSVLHKTTHWHLGEPYIKSIFSLPVSFIVHFLQKPSPGLPLISTCTVTFLWARPPTTQHPRPEPGQWNQQ